jgi:hypothetical protein
MLYKAIAQMHTEYMLRLQELYKAHHGALYLTADILALLLILQSRILCHMQGVIEHVDEGLRQQLAQLPFLFNKNMKLVKAPDVYVLDVEVSAP